MGEQEKTKSRAGRAKRRRKAFLLLSTSNARALKNALRASPSELIVLRRGSSQKLVKMVYRTPSGARRLVKVISSNAATRRPEQLPPRQPGALRGQIVMAPDFDELPSDVLAVMVGEGG